METRVIRAARWKFLLAFLPMVAVTAAAVTLAMSRHGPASWPLWFCAVVCGGFSLVFVRTLFRPMRLVLDEAGFTMEGGLLVPRKTIPWTDISEFFVWDYRGWKSLGWRLQPQVTDRPMITVNGKVGRYGRTANMWALGPDELVPVLNAYLQGATTGQEVAQPDDQARKLSKPMDMAPVITGAAVAVIMFFVIGTSGWRNYGWKGLATCAVIVAITLLMILFILMRPGRKAKRP